MPDVLVVYKQVEMLFDKDGNLLPYDGHLHTRFHTMKSQTFKPLGELKTELQYREKAIGKETVNTRDMAH